MKDKYIFGMFAIAILAAMEISAMFMGINGQFFGLVLATIGGIVGTVLGVAIPKNIREKLNGG